LGPENQVSRLQPIAHVFSYPKVLKRTVSSLSRAAEMKQQAAHSDQSRSAEQRGTPTVPLLQHRVEAEVVHASNLRMLPGSHGQLLMLEVGRAGADIPPVVAGSWKLEADCQSPCDITASSPPPDGTMIIGQ